MALLEYAEVAMMAHSPARLRPLLACAGMVAAIFGIGLLRQPLAMAKGSLLVFGVAALALGLIGFCIPQHHGGGSATRYGSGFCVILGIVSLGAATLPLTVWAYVIAAQALFAGIVQFVIAITIRATLLLATVLSLCALVSLALGVMLFLAPTVTLLAFLSFCGACFCACGLLLLALALSLLIPT